MSGVTMAESVTVIKRNPEGQETWRYEGKVLEHNENSVKLEALFIREDRPFHGWSSSVGTGS